MPSPARIPHPNSLLLALMLLALAAPLTPAQDDSQPVAPPIQGDIAADSVPKHLGSIVDDAEAEPNARLDAAVALVRAGSARESLVVINTLLGQAPGPESGVRVLLRAMASQAVVPSELWPPLSLIPADGDPDLRVLIARAAASFRTREAAAILVDLAERDPEPRVRSAAAESLTRLSGSTRPNEPGAWDAWLQSQGSVDGLAWLRGLIKGLSERADALADRLESAELQLVATNRRLHLALPPKERSALLASLLRDSVPRLRQLGFDLVDRELASSTQLDDDVGQAAIELLEHNQPRVRRQAALLVIRLAPEKGAEAVGVRLAIEQEPSVAEALLRGVARWPRPGLEADVVRWAIDDTQARRGAINAAWSLHRSGCLSDESARDALLGSLRGRSPETHEPTALHLLVAIGDESDLQRVRALLSGDNADARRRAGEALVPDPGSVDAVVEAASSDPAMYDLAAQSLTQHRADAAGLRALLALAPPTPEHGAMSVETLGSLLRVEQLLDVSGDIADTELRERLLSRVLGAPASTPRTQAIVVLASARLDLGRAAEALLALDAIDQTEHAPSARETDVRAASLLALGRAEEATPLEASADAWIRGFELSIGSPHAQAVLDLINTRFEGTLTPEQQQRLSLLEQALAEATTPGDDTPADEGP